jgi:hypothetical protein
MKKNDKPVVLNIKAEPLRTILKELWKYQINDSAFLNTDPQLAFPFLPDKIDNYTLPPEAKLRLLLETTCPSPGGRTLLLDLATGTLGRYANKEGVASVKAVMESSCQFNIREQSKANRLFRLDAGAAVYQRFFSKDWPWNNEIYDEFLPLIPDVIKGLSLNVLDKKEMIEDCINLKGFMVRLSRQSGFLEIRENSQRKPRWNPIREIDCKFYERKKDIKQSKNKRTKKVKKIGKDNALGT